MVDAGTQKLMRNLLQRGIIHVTIPYNLNTLPVKPHPMTNLPEVVFATADVSSCQGGMFPITFAKAGTANIVHFTIAYDLLKNGS